MNTQDHTILELKVIDLEIEVQNLKDSLSLAYSMLSVQDDVIEDLERELKFVKDNAK